MVDICNLIEKRKIISKAHFFRYVKRALPNDNEYIREHLDSSRDLMIIIESFVPTDEYLHELREYFSSYGVRYACKYSHEKSFDYILIEFADYGISKRRILLKELNVFFQIKSIVFFSINLIIFMAKNLILLNVQYGIRII